MSGTASKPSYRWPRTLRLPSRPPKIVYLDLNHWISLAKASTGHRDGMPHVESLSAVARSVEERAALFPLSDSIYAEVSKIQRHRQRSDLREVIERVSGYRVVTSRLVVTAHEVEALLDVIVGPSPDPISTLDFVDWGIARAFGLVGGFRVRSASGEDVTDQARAAHRGGPEAFDHLLAAAELNLNRQVIEGPTPDEEPKLRAHGYDPAAAYAVAERRAAQEIEQASRFDDEPRWRRGRIRDVIAAREVYIEINTELSRGFEVRGATLEETLSSPDEVREAFDAMPSFDVAVTLKTAYHRDSNHHWTPNDILDIDALGSTLPYCDIVVTDKAAASTARRTGLSERLETVVLSDLPSLMEHL